MGIIMRGGAALVATALCAALGVPAAAQQPVQQPAQGARAASAATVNRVAETVLRKGRYDYRRENWRIREADGLPGWLRLRNGYLSGSAPRLGRWRITLEERGIREQRGAARRTVLVLRSVTPRAASGTVLVTRGVGGRPADADSRDVTLSGDGGTVVFSSRATNLVPGVEEPVGRLYVWDTATQRVALLHPEHWAVLAGISHDGRRVLVRLTAGLFLVDRTDGSVTRVAERAVGAALTTDGERVLYQDRGNELDSPEPRLLEWTRATGATRTVAEQLGTRTLAGLSADGRFAVLGDLYSSQVLDTTTGTWADLGLLGIEGGSVTWLDISDDGRLLSVRGSGLPGGSGSSGRPFALVHDTVRGRHRGPLGNTGTAITAGGTHYAVATATRHLRVVEAATGVQTSPFAARPSGQETWASLSDDVARVAYVSDGHDLLPGTRRGVANVFLWVRTR